MSSFVHSPATLSDLPAISQIQRAAFKESQHTMSYWTFPQHNETGIYEWRLNSMKKIFQNVPYSYALWESPHPSGTEEKPQKEKEETANGDAGDVLPEGTNVELFHDFEAETERMRLKYVNSDKDYVLRAIATLPEYQGKGCASMLLRSGLAKIDAEGAKAWLEATPQGQSLYAKFGWKVVDEIVFDLEKYGCGKWVQRTTVMERSAQV